MAAWTADGRPDPMADGSTLAYISEPIFLPYEEYYKALAFSRVDYVDEVYYGNEMSSTLLYGLHPGDWGSARFMFNPECVPENATSVTFYVKAAVSMAHLSLRYYKNAPKNDETVWPSFQADNSFTKVIVANNAEPDWIQITISGDYFKALIDPNAEGALYFAMSPKQEDKPLAYLSNPVFY